MIVLKCPNCGADLQLEDSKEFAFCMHCGTKILIHDTIGKNPEKDKLNNLISLGKNSVDTGSSSDLQNISMKILEIDSNNWFGWYLKGVAMAKAAQCYAMYDAWEKAAEFIPQDEYLKLREDFIYFSAKASIGYGIEDPKNGVPDAFIRKIDPKEPEGETRFAVSVIDEMCEMRGLITVETAYNTIVNGCQIALAELLVYTDIGCWGGCYESLEKLDRIVRSTKGVYGSLGELCFTEMLPPRTLNECLEKSKFSDEDQDKAADYWADHDPSEYLDYYFDAEEAADALYSAGGLTAMSLKRRIKKDMEALVSTYYSHI